MHNYVYLSSLSVTLYPAYIYLPPPPGMLLPLSPVPSCLCVCIYPFITCYPASLYLCPVHVVYAYMCVYYLCTLSRIIYLYFSLPLLSLSGSKITS